MSVRVHGGSRSWRLFVVFSWQESYVTRQIGIDSDRAVQVARVWGRMNCWCAPGRLRVATAAPHHGFEWEPYVGQPVRACGWATNCVHDYM
eukprot:967909-Pyramimonas_sp.AAC.1